MNTKPEFDYAAAVRSIQGVSVTEYNLYSDSVARVICTVVGDMDRATMSDRLAAVFGNRVSPIRSSFRWLEKNRAAIGFVRLTPAVRAYSKETVEAKYTRINANLFMDPSDESIWEIRPGSGGSYLARKGNDNLAELIEASRVSPRGSTPRMHSVLSAMASRNSMMAFVEEEGSLVDYGFYLTAKDGKYSVLSTTTNAPVEIPSIGVVGVYDLEIPKEILSAIAPKGPTKVKAAADISTQIEYYKRLYAYAPDYLEKVIVQIEQMAAM